MPAKPSPARRPGRPARPDSAAVRDQLLDIATDLFATQGVAATRLAHIAERAGVTSAMLHYYFKSRDQLLDAVVLERVVPVISYVWSPDTYACKPHAFSRSSSACATPTDEAGFWPVISRPSDTMCGCQSGPLL
jgi:AcrR family transcriptional regulator